MLMAGNYACCIASDINSSGQVVGYSRTADNKYSAFPYSAGQLSYPPTLVGLESFAGTLKDPGQIAGTGVRRRQSRMSQENLQ